MDGSFQTQINNIENFGLVYYQEKYQKKYTSLTECYNDVLNHFITVNKYDPMQLHGIKSLKELKELAEINSIKKYKMDQTVGISINKMSVNVADKENLINRKKKIESDKNFIRWC